jgi:hypothetical protein
MKKLFALLLMLACCISFASCSFITNNNNDGEEPVEVRHTITIDEWREAGKINNFSLLFNDSIGAGISKHANGYIGEEFFYKNGSKSDLRFYANIDGVAYDIQKTDEGYVASKAEESELGTSLPFDIAYLLTEAFGVSWGTIYDNLIYVEECKIYRAYVETQSMIERAEAVEIEVECENGGIKKMTVRNIGRDTREPLPFSVTFYNFGTTVVELPDFTFADQ